MAVAILSNPIVAALAAAVVAAFFESQRRQMNQIRDLRDEVRTVHTKVQERTVPAHEQIPDGGYPQPSDEDEPDCEHGLSRRAIRARDADD